MHSPNLNGILLINKVKGPTSNAALNDIKQSLCKVFSCTKKNLPKIGHGGTLDPFATGLLVVLLGKATKRSSEFLGGTKEYSGIITIGETTVPGDPTSPVSATSEHLPNSLEQIEIQAKTFLGEYIQIPPMHSAIKIDGKRLYDLAREGITVEREPRKSFVESFDVWDFVKGDNTVSVHFRCKVSSGTYIRVLAQDLGTRLGSVGMLQALQRETVKDLSLESSVTVADLPNFLSGNLTLENVPFFRSV